MSAAKESRDQERMCVLEESTVSFLRLALESYEKGDLETAMTVAACAGRTAREYNQRRMGVFDEDAEAITYHLRRLQGDTVEASMKSRRKPRGKGRV